MVDGTFRYSLYLSANVLHDSPMYSLSQSSIATLSSVYHPAFLPDSFYVFGFYHNGEKIIKNNNPTSLH